MPEDTSQPVAVEKPKSAQPKKPPAKKVASKPKSAAPDPNGGVTDNMSSEKMDEPPSIPATPAPKKTVAKKSVPKPAEPAAEEISTQPKENGTTPDKAEPEIAAEKEKEAPPAPKPKAKVVAKKPVEAVKPEAAPNDDMKV